MNIESPKPCVLIAEDEFMVATLLEDLLSEAGYRVFVAATLEAATTLARTEAIEVALLDVHLGRDDSFPLADTLRERGVPFLFASGHGRDALPERFADSPVLQKPYNMQALERSLQGLLPPR